MPDSEARVQRKKVMVTIRQSSCGLTHGVECAFLQCRLLRRNCWCSVAALQGRVSIAPGVLLFLDEKRIISRNAAIILCARGKK